MPIQPHSVITNWIAATHSKVVPFHYVEQEVMKDAACDKYFLALLHLAKYEPMIQHLPPLFLNTKITFNVLLDTLQIC
jgi:hypothetical protein